MKSDYDLIMEALLKGNIKELEEFSKMIDSFPLGKDGFINRDWIVNAIDCENLDSINWLLSKKPNIEFVDDEGRTVLTCTLEMISDSKYELLKQFLELGVPADLSSCAGYTALHHAACENDLKAFEILVEYGADVETHSIVNDYSNAFMFAQKYKSDLILDWFEKNKKRA